MTRILGIDPGSLITGYGIIDMDGNHARHVDHGIIRVKGESLPIKLRVIFEQITEVLAEFQPDEMSIEKVFMHKNADSAIKLGQARGAAITACAVQRLEIFEYTANQVKQATVGKGHAAKEQVQHMVKILLCLDKKPQADAGDALAIALCHGHSREGIKRMDVGISSINKGRMR
ncbi:MAG: crossover junction endodeoxyribonuclease RuvC [Gammaproteobacteria bacterium]|nr:crossover junction endodeoxyribonuclease RuvC [Gammaproteobacteria bacterium]